MYDRAPIICSCEERRPAKDKAAIEKVLRWLMSRRLFLQGQSSQMPTSPAQHPNRRSLQEQRLFVTKSRTKNTNRPSDRFRVVLRASDARDRLFLLAECSVMRPRAATQCGRAAAAVLCASPALHLRPFERPKRKQAARFLPRFGALTSCFRLLVVSPNSDAW